MKKSDESREMYKVNGKNFNAKVNLDKYYTPIELAKYCIDKAYDNPMEAYYEIYKLILAIDTEQLVEYLENASK